MAQFLSIAKKKEFAGLAGAKPRRGNAPARLVLHTTETKTLPAYSSPPHFTIGVGHPGSMPSLADGDVSIWQHIAIGRTAYALLHPKGTEETNHMGSHCIQIEMITYVGDQPKAGIVGNRGNLPEPLLRAAAGLVQEIRDAVPDISLDAPPAKQWSAVKSHGPNAKQRFSAAEWRDFNGICGHQHVPANAHWDPGQLDIEAFVGLVRGEDVHFKKPPSTDTDTPFSDGGWPKILESGDRNHKVVAVRGFLQALGYGDFSDSDLYNDDVATAVERMQKDFKIKVDGEWGPQTHRAVITRVDTTLARADV